MPIIITQVGEASSGNDKFVEISNTGPGSIDLTGYRLGFSANGEGTAIGDLDFTTLTDLMGGATSLAAGETIVIYNGGSTPALVTAAGSATHSGSGVANHNGNDAYLLFDGSDTLVDSVGDADSNADDATMDSNLTRTDFTPDTNATDAVDTATQWSQAAYAGGDPGGLGMVCFARGTRITTNTGGTAVEALRVNDKVVTADGDTVTVKWVGRQTIVTRFHKDRVALVHIAKGALGDGLPARDLTVTPDHGMILDGMVINASALVNGTSISLVQADALPERFTVFHIETEGHRVIFAEGAASESFLDMPSRRVFDNFAEYTALYGEETVICEMTCPRLTSQRLLPSELKQKLGIVETDPLVAFSG